MITLETSIKIGKSPKKPPMEVSDESGTDSESDEFYSRDNEADMESAHEGLAENVNRSGFNFEADSENSNTEEDKEENSDVFSAIINKTKANPGWADAMRKVLSNKKPKRKKSIVLSKAKKHCNIELKEKEDSLSFEIEDPHNKEEKETVTKKNVNDQVTREKRRKKKEIKSGIRIKPSVLDRERERTLQKIATKGVLQLFNAVNNQQMEIDKKLKEAGSLERKREKVFKDIDKKAFLDVLMGGTKSINVDDTTNKITMKNEASTEKNSVWKILRDDFVMGASLKDWDKKSPEEENSSAPEEIDSDE